MRIVTDSRIFERIKGELAVRYSPRGSEREFCTTTKNISGGRIRLSLLKRINPGTVLDLEIFKYNTDIKVICRGKVVWIWDEAMDKERGQLFEAGIEFINARFLYIARLISYLEAQNKNLLL